MVLFFLNQIFAQETMESNNALEKTVNLKKSIYINLYGKHKRYRKH